MSERVPWSAITEYDEGRLGKVGISSASETEEQALKDAREWLRTHPPRKDDLYLRPSSVIKVRYRNVYTGEPDV